MTHRIALVGAGAISPWRPGKGVSKFVFEASVARERPVRGYSLDATLPSVVEIHRTMGRVCA